MNFDKRSSQRNNEWRTVCPIQFRGIKSRQMLKSAERDISAVTVGDNKLSGLRAIKMLSRYIFRQNLSGFLSFENCVFA